MRVDLRTQSAGKSRLRSTCQATVPTLMILMTLVSCSRPMAHMPEPGYRVMPPELSFFSRLTVGESQQLTQRKVDEQSVHRAEQQRISPRPQGCESACAGYSHRACFASRWAKNKHVTVT